MKPHARFTQRLWWIDVLYPFTYIAIAIATMTIFIFTGPDQFRPEYRAKLALLNWQLESSSRIARNAVSDVVIISVTSNNLIGEYANPVNSLDLSVDHYFNLLSKILSQKPKVLVLRWFDRGKATDDGLIELISRLKKLSLETKVVIAVPPHIMKLIPRKISPLIELASDNICSTVLYFTGPYCPYDAKWNDWAPQVVLTAIEGGKNLGMPGALNYQLGPSPARFFLNFAEPASLVSYKATDILDRGSEENFSDKYVFIGVDGPYQRNDRYASLGLKGNATFLQLKNTDEKTELMPMHMFLALTAEMKLSGKYLRVLKTEWHNCLLVIFCLSILTVVLRRSIGRTLWPVFIMCFFMLVINFLLINFANFYLILFDFLFFGAMIFVFAFFGKLSWLNYKKWKMEAESIESKNLSDLKVNFISLLSHNLNTPIAKLQGMLDLLRMSFPDLASSATGKDAQKNVSMLLLSVRSVLVNTSLEDGAYTMQALTVKKLMEEFSETAGKNIGRMGVNIELSVDDDNEEYSYLVLQIDKKTQTAFFGALCGMAQNEFSVTQLKIRNSVELLETGNEALWTIVIDFDDKTDATALIEDLSLLHASDTDNFVLTKKFAFFKRVYARLILNCLDKFRGKLLLDGDRNPNQIKIQFRSDVA